MDREWVMEDIYKGSRNSDYRHNYKVEIMRDFVFSSFLAIAILALTPLALAAHGEEFLTEGDSSNTGERFADTESPFHEDFLDTNGTPDEGEDPSAYDMAIKWLETHFIFTERSIRDIADVLERAADVAKKGDGSELRDHLISNLRSGLPVPRSIWGVTVFDLSSSRRAASDEQLDDQSWVVPGVGDRSSEQPDEFDGQLREFDAVLKMYANPETLFRRENGDPASMVDVNLDPGAGACVQFLRELSIVRQLAQVAFPNIEIADVPPLNQRSLGHRVRGRHQRIFQGRTPYRSGMPDDLSSSRSLEMGRAYEPQGSATTAIDISESVVRWVRSLADNVHTGFAQILQTERLSSKKDQINNEKLIERVKNANMMVQALKLYTSSVRYFYTDNVNDNSISFWQTALRVDARTEHPIVEHFAEAAYQGSDARMKSIESMRSFWGKIAADSMRSFGGEENDAPDEEFFDAIDSFPNEDEENDAPDEEFFDAIDSFPNEGRDDLAFSRITTEDELEGELRIDFDNIKLARLLAHKFKTRPHSDEQIREAVSQNNGKELYLMVICPVCRASMHYKTLATPACGHAIHELCLEGVKDVCPLCGHKGPHKNTKVETLLKSLLQLFEDEGVIPEPKDPYLLRAMGFVEAHFRFTAETIRGIADTLENAAEVVKEKTLSTFGLQQFWSLGHDRPIPRAIWGVTVFDSYDHERSWINAWEPREDDGKALDYTWNIHAAQYDGLALTYNNPKALFRRANGDFASMDDVKRDPEAGARHARVHFLRELSIVRQLAQVAFPNIEIANVPSLASTAKDISASVVSWLRSLADNVLTGLDQILQTESLSSSNKETLIARVQNAHMMVQALILYTSGVDTHSNSVYGASTQYLQPFLRRPANRMYASDLSSIFKNIKPEAMNFQEGDVPSPEELEELDVQS